MKKLNSDNSTQRNRIEKGFDFLKGIDTKARNIKQSHSFWTYFIRYLKPLPLFLFLALFLVFSVDSSGGKTIVSEMSGSEKYIFAVLVVLLLFTIFAFLAALLFPPIIQCEFKDGSYSSRFKVNFTDAAKLLEIVKTTENLKTMSAMIKTGMDNSGDSGNILLTLLASIGIFIGSFTILLGLKLLDGGILTPLIGLAGIYFLNVLRLELVSQNTERRVWLLIIEKAQNLKFDDQRIITLDQNMIIISGNGRVGVQNRVL